MSHAVAAAVGEVRVNLPVAGLMAATAIVVVLSQFHTMAKLGRYASLVSVQLEPWALQLEPWAAQSVQSAAQPVLSAAQMEQWAAQLEPLVVQRGQ